MKALCLVPLMTVFALPRAAFSQTPAAAVDVTFAAEQPGARGIR